MSKEKILIVNNLIIISTVFEFENFQYCVLQFQLVKEFRAEGMPTEKNPSQLLHRQIRNNAKTTRVMIFMYCYYP